jgi:hypothetical protein
LVDWAYCEIWAFGSGEHTGATDHHEVSVLEQMRTYQCVVATPTAGCVIIMRCLWWMNVRRKVPIFLGEVFQISWDLRLQALTVALLAPTKGRDLWGRLIIRAHKTG